MPGRNLRKATCFSMRIRMPRLNCYVGTMGPSASWTLEYNKEAADPPGLERRGTNIDLGLRGKGTIFPDFL